MQNKKKIFMYIYSLHTGGGAENVLFKVSRYLQANGFEIVVCGMLDEEPSFEHDFKALGIKVVRLSGQGCSVLAIIGRLVKVLTVERPDIMCNWLFPCIFTGGLAGWLARVPVLISNLRGPDLKKNKLKVLADMLVHRLYTGTIAVSQGVADVFIRREKYVPQKITVINNGINLQNIPQGSLRTELGLSDNYVVGTIGRLYTEKNQQLLLRAFASVARQVPQARLLLVGDGPAREELEALAKHLGISAAIVWAGWQREVFPYLRSMDVFVLPSRYEGHSNAIMQAWLAKVPVVATKVVGIKETVVDGKTGILCDVQTPHELAQVLINLQQYPEYAQALAVNGYAEVQERYAEELTYAQYAQYFLGQSPRLRR